MWCAFHVDATRDDIHELHRCPTPQLPLRWRVVHVAIVCASTALGNRYLAFYILALRCLNGGRSATCILRHLGDRRHQSHRIQVQPLLLEGHLPFGIQYRDQVAMRELPAGVLRVVDAQ